MPAIDVSVVIPAYNAAGLVEHAVRSALDQADEAGGGPALDVLPALEVLVVDDASADDTAAVVGRLAAADPRVRLLRQPANAGPSAARNRALAAARGAWVALLDADDRFAPGRLARLLDLAARTGADLVADNLMLCDGEGRETGAMVPPFLLAEPRRLTLPEFVALNEGGLDRRLRELPVFNMGFLKPVLRRAFLERHGLRYDERNRYAEDFMFAARALAAGGSWWLTPEAGYLYTVRPGTATHVQTAGDLGRIVAFDQRLLDDPAVGRDPDARRALHAHRRSVERRYHYRRFVDALKDRRFGTARALLLESGTSAADVLRLGAWNLPIVLAKAVRGGYRAG